MKTYVIRRNGKFEAEADGRDGLIGFDYDERLNRGQEFIGWKAILPAVIRDIEAMGYEVYEQVTHDELYYRDLREKGII